MVILAIIAVWLLDFPALAHLDHRWARDPVSSPAAQVGIDSILDDDDSLDATAILVAGDPAWPHLAVRAVVIVSAPVVARFAVDRLSESRAPPSR
jgi:hypothetical protein